MTLETAVLACLMLVVCGTIAEAQTPEPVAPETFTIMTWGSTPGDPEVLREIKACGFNLAGFVAPESLDAVQAAGLKAMVIEGSCHVGDGEAELDDAEIARRVAGVVGKVKGHPALFGYYLRDEPSARPFPGIARWVAAYEKADPASLPYVNLFPNYASPDQLGVASYDAYLDEFVAKVKPKFISYDHYALMDDGGLRGGYFQNLEAVRRAALENSLPFWNIVLSNAHFTYAEPSEGGLRFQAYTTLAYGARGISYFTYFAPHVGNYRLAPIDQFGNKTATWDMLRNVNLQIQALAPTYVTLKSVNVFHHPNVPEGCKGLDSSRFLKSLEGGDLLAGEFEGPAGEPYVLIVNKDLHRSIAFGFEPKSAGGISIISSYTGQPMGFGGEQEWLAAGQGMLLRLGQK